MTDLERKIVEYNTLYREGNPAISDQQYDYLMVLLEAEQPDSELLNKAVLEVAKESRKEKLPIPMFSLEKDKSIDEIKKWMVSNDLPEDIDYVISPKLDGISLVVDESTNKKALTRGDGLIGQESTPHFQKMNRTDHNDYRFVHTYGEAIMSKSNWVNHFLGKLSPHTGKPYKSARNLVGGLINADDAREELQYVDYIRYGLSSERNKDEMLGVCNSLNAVQFPFKVVKANEITDELLDELFNEWRIDYQIDGLVIDINDSVLRVKVGRERNSNPKYARAIKLPKWGENVIVKVLALTWQVSKQGNLKPVINIEPTDIGGATISNVTGYNAKYVFDNHIAVGSVIEITRSGDVIPKHLNTISYDAVLFSAMRMNMKCPCCGGNVFFDETNTELFCINPDCDEMKISKMVHFFRTLEVEEFGEPTIIKFYNRGYWTPLEVLKMGYDEIISIEGFAEKSTNNLLKEFNKLKENGTTLAKLIHASDCMNGRLGSKMIQSILDELMGGDPYNQKVENLVQIKGIAEISAQVFISGMQEFLKPMYQDLFDYVTVNVNTQTEIVGIKFAGYKVCFTGVRPSKEQEAEIKSQGGEIVSGVSKNTTHLVVKDLSEKTLKSGKSVTAKSLGIEVITLESLFA